MSKTDANANAKFEVRLLIRLNSRWASHLTDDEIRDYIQQRLNSSLGFRGQVKEFAMKRQVSGRKRTVQTSVARRV